MPLPVISTTAADAYARMRGAAAQMHSIALQLQELLAAGSVPCSFLVDVLSVAAGTQTIVQTMMQVPGTHAYAVSQIGVSEVDVTGTLASGSAAVTQVNPAGDLIAGMTVSGPGIADGTIVQALPDPTSITLSQPATADGTSVSLVCTLELNALVRESLMKLGALSAAIVSEYPIDSTTGHLLDRVFDADGLTVWQSIQASSLPNTAAANAAFIATLS